ncbi:catenin alpha-2-like [Clytia hemisphaerica]|uniref:catenin alpha-2-like n=1 Tax=Clytia hemisphaerica TaxID=252671 RepID=UPI0034D56EF6
MALNSPKENNESAINSLNLAWDPKTIEIRTRSVEKALEPLIIQVTTLVNHSKKNQKLKRGRSKKAVQLVKDIDQATARLVDVGQDIAEDYQEVKIPMLEACTEAEEAGKVMHDAATEFALDPCTPSKRGTMVKSARILLSSVTRLLCIADMADVHRLLTTLKKVEERLKELEVMDTADDLLSAFKHYGNDLMQFAKLTGLRQADLKDARRKDEMAAARATLKRTSKMLLTTSKAYVSHPDLQSTKQNRDYVVDQVSSAVATISGVAQAVGESQRHPYEEVGYLARALDELMAQLEREPEDFHDKENQNDLHLLVDDIVTGASNLAESVCTREKTRQKIFNESRHVKVAIKGLIDECDNHAHRDKSDVDGAKRKVGKKAKDLTKQLTRSVVDHVSDSFLETNVPILLLIKAAESGNGREVEDCSNLFMGHADKLQKVADLACSMSTNVEGIKMVKIAAHQLKLLCPQVVNAAHTLTDRPKSKHARENMSVFKEAWLQQVAILTEAVDDITTIDDFLTVSEAHILEDINHCIEAMQSNDPETLDRTAGAVRGRVKRVDHVVMSEMLNYEPGQYTDSVYRAVGTMKNRIMVEFAECVEMVVDALSKGNVGDVDEALFIDVAGLVHEGMRDIRKAVALRDDEESEESELDEDPLLKESLLNQLAEAQIQQRERLAYEQLIAGGKIQFEVHSEGLDDPGCKGKPHIVVNGVDYCPHKRGHNVVVLDQCGNVVKQQAFDTTQHKEGVAMAKFLDEIPENHIALIAVQETGGDGIKAAAEALKRFGAKDVDAPYGASWAFAGYKGDHENKGWVTEVARPRYQGPAMISDMINTPAADMGQIHVSIHAEGCEDNPYDRIASVKINSIERSPMGRGMNVVVLDKSGNYLLSKNFDTADPYHAVNEGKRMSKFLDELPEDRIVAIASLESVGDGLEEAKEALYRVGARPPIDPGQNGSFAFIGYTSPAKVGWLKQVHKKRRQGPSKINEFILTPAAVEEVILEEEEEEQVFEEPAYHFDENKYERIILSSEEEPVKHSASSIMRSLPDEEKAKISKLNEGFLLEKNRLISEVSRWDDSGNEIIVLAKRMCMIMMDMSDFTRISLHCQDYFLLQLFLYRHCFE